MHLDPKLHRRLKIRAAQEGRTMNALLADAVLAYLRTPRRRKGAS